MYRIFVNVFVLMYLLVLIYVFYTISWKLYKQNFKLLHLLNCLYILQLMNEIVQLCGSNWYWFLFVFCFYSLHKTYIFLFFFFSSPEPRSCLPHHDKRWEPRKYLSIPFITFFFLSFTSWSLYVEVV